ncbi:MAG: hypothetical protein WD555_01750 [Fulvivirga sp.]
MTLHINRPYDAPILYRKHNGYYSFEIQNSSVVNININYQGKLKSSGLFAKLYWVTSTPIGSDYPDFTIKDLSGQTLKSGELKGRVTLFFLWDPDSKSEQEYYQLLNELAADFDEVSFISWSRYPSKVRKFKAREPDSNFRFSAVQLWQAGVKQCHVNRTVGMVFGDNSVIGE